MIAEYFIDTNVLVYHLDTSDRRKHDVARRIVREGLDLGNACISWQVSQECLNVITRRAERKLTPSEARDYFDVVLAPLMKLNPSEAIYRSALDVQSRWRFSFYDSLIVASALAAGCKTLLTEDLQHGQKIDALTVFNPFA